MARTGPRQPGPPAGVIFGCNRSSEEESLNGLFGMSSGHWSLVKEIMPGTPCFLFNFNTKVCLSTLPVSQLPLLCRTDVSFISSHLVWPDFEQFMLLLSRNCMEFSKLCLLEVGILTP